MEFVEVLEADPLQEWRAGARSYAREFRTPNVEFNMTMNSVDLPIDGYQDRVKELLGDTYSEWAHATLELFNLASQNNRDGIVDLISQVNLELGFDEEISTQVLDIVLDSYDKARRPKTDETEEPAFDVEG